AGRGDHSRPDVLHRTRRAQPGQCHVLQVRHPDLGTAGHPAAGPLQGDPRRTGPGARRRSPPDRRRLSRRRPRAVPPARAPRGPGPAAWQAASDGLGLQGRPSIAYLGPLEPRKNVPALITGWAAAVDDMEDPPALVLAGGTGWSEEVDAAIASVPARLRLVRP